MPSPARMRAVRLVHGIVRAVHGTVRLVHGIVRAVHGTVRLVHGIVRAVHSPARLEKLPERNGRPSPINHSPIHQLTH